tara:strand:+ start:12133 stop:12954 length:822 start_codon:yes stop_codon:yes gene_type:complete
MFEVFGFVIAVIFLLISMVSANSVYKQPNITPNTTPGKKPNNTLDKKPNGAAPTNKPTKIKRDDLITQFIEKSPYPVVLISEMYLSLKIVDGPPVYTFGDVKLSTVRKVIVGDQFTGDFEFGDSENGSSNDGSSNGNDHCTLVCILAPTSRDSKLVVNYARQYLYMEHLKPQRALLSAQDFKHSQTTAAFTVDIARSDYHEDLQIAKDFGIDFATDFSLGRLLFYNGELHDTTAGKYLEVTDTTITTADTSSTTSPTPHTTPSKKPPMSISFI